MRFTSKYTRSTLLSEQYYTTNKRFSSLRGESNNEKDGSFNEKRSEENPILKETKIST